MTAEQLIAAFQGYLTAGDGYIPSTAGEVWTQAKQDKLAAKNAMVQRYGSKWIGHRVEDCSGAFVYAYRQRGLSIYHGSNRIAREYVRELLPPDQARPGMAAFKAREPGDKLYNLPTEYRQGGRHYNGDLLDYYHIGLVDSDPAYVLNSQSTATGFVRSKIKSGWAAVAELKAVQYEKGGDEPVENKRMIVTGNGYVNMRSGNSKSSPVITKLYPGNIVTQTMEKDGWAYVVRGDKKGYVMSQFLEPYVSADEQSSTELDTAALTKYLYDALEANQKQREALEAMQRLITGAVG